MKELLSVRQSTQLENMSLIVTQGQMGLKALRGSLYFAYLNA